MLWKRHVCYTKKFDKFWQPKRFAYVVFSDAKMFRRFDLYYEERCKTQVGCPLFYWYTKLLSIINFIKTEVIDPSTIYFYCFLNFIYSHYLNLSLQPFILFPIGWTYIMKSGAKLRLDYNHLSFFLFLFLIHYYHNYLCLNFKILTAIL